ncbi:MAG: bifunctional metallophosphatase/5'-nucleotidase [Methylococcaceae bacterium]|nr:bifunctional metallophosphatase/5'-nucleotidase [Methylococcaceae bacterium]
MRGFLPALLLPAVLLCSCSTGPGIGKPAWIAGFTLLQVNDTYKIEGLENGSKGGFARLRTLRRQLEASGRPVLVLHAGDLLFPSVMSKYLMGRPMIQTLNLLDGAAGRFDPLLIATFGNHEFDSRDPAVLLERVGESEFDWVSANVYFRPTPEAPAAPFGDRLKQVREAVVRELDGVKVGVFGLTTDAQERDYIRYDYADPLARSAAVRRALDRLRDAGAQVIVALTHQDLAEDEKLAAEFPEIDLIAGGHEHFHIARKVGRTWIGKADSDIQSAIVWDIQVDARGVVGVEPRKLDVGAEIAPDPLLRAEADRNQDLLRQAMRQARGHAADNLVGRTTVLLEGVETAVRSRETALGNFLADVIRTRLGTDIGLINGGAIRINDNIPPGPITELDMEGIFYFDDRLVAFRLNGSELLEMLRNSVSKRHLGDGRFLQVSGLRFRYRNVGSTSVPNYTVDARDVKVLRGGRFEPLQLNRTYRVGSTDFIWKSGYIDGYRRFAAGNGGSSPPRLAGPDLDFRRAAEDMFDKLPNRTVTTTVEGRITEASGAR